MEKNKKCLLCKKEDNCKTFNVSENIINLCTNCKDDWYVKITEFGEFLVIKKNKKVYHKMWEDKNYKIVKNEDELRRIFNSDFYELLNIIKE